MKFLKVLKVSVSDIKQLNLRTSELFNGSFNIYVMGQANPGRPTNLSNSRSTNTLNRRN